MHTINLLTDDFLVLGSDGIFEVLSADGLVAIIWECALRLQLAALKKEGEGVESVTVDAPDPLLNLSSELARQKASRNLGVPAKRSMHLKIDQVLHQTNECSGTPKDDSDRKEPSGKREAPVLHAKSNKKANIEELRGIIRAPVKEGSKLFSKPLADKPTRPRQTEAEPAYLHPHVGSGRQTRLHDIGSGQYLKVAEPKSLANPSKPGIKRKPTAEHPPGEPPVSPRSEVQLPYVFTAQQLAAEVLREIRERNASALGGSDNLSLVIAFLHRGLKRARSPAPRLT